MALKDIIVATQADLRANADHAVAIFSADSRQVEGLRSEAKIRQFSLTVDEPPNLGGTDTGPKSRRAGTGGARHVPGNYLPGLRHRAWHPARERLRQTGRLARPARLLRRERRRSRRLQRGPRRRRAEKQRASRRSRQTEGSGRRALSGARYSARAGAGGPQAENRAGGPGSLDCGAKIVGRAKARASRHCERSEDAKRHVIASASEAIQPCDLCSGLLRRFSPRNDESTKAVPYPLPSRERVTGVVLRTPFLLLATRMPSIGFGEHPRAKRVRRPRGKIPLTRLGLASRPRHLSHKGRGKKFIFLTTERRSSRALLPALPARTRNASARPDRARGTLSSAPQRFRGQAP